MKKEAYVYIVSSYKKTIYVGVTNNLQRRLLEHKKGINNGFSKRYKCHRLVYYEYSDYFFGAIAREKQIKKWRREKKIYLIESVNPEWKDLSEGWG